MPQENVQADPVLLTHLLNETIDKRLDILRRVDQLELPQGRPRRGRELQGGLAGD